METLALCACERPATANGRECPACFRDRIRGVANLYRPTATQTLKGETARKRWDSRLERFRETVAEGSMPRDVSNEAIDEARKLSDATGQPFRADAASQ